LRLSLYSDFALRALMYLAGAEHHQPVRTAAIAQKYGISHFHLQKSVHGLRRLGYVTSSPGRNGGLRLAVPSASVKIGSLIAKLEETGLMVACHKGPCPLFGACALKGALDRAERVFYDSLDQYTLADVTKGKTLVALQRLIA
jgi:Rrf2 family nitric oxide-sensitive transcriptional repressor